MKRLVSLFIAAVAALSAQQTDWVKGLRNLPVVDIRSFGAKCDGATDDRAAIQAALNSLTVGGRVIAPAGVCAYTPPLIPKIVDSTLHSYHLILSGSGPATGAIAPTTFKALGSGKMFDASVSVNTSLPWDSDLTIENLTFDGNHLATYGIFTDYTNAMIISHVSVMYTTIDNFHLGDNLSGVSYMTTVDNCYSNGEKVAGGAQNRSGFRLTNMRYIRLLNNITDGSDYSVWNSGGDGGMLVGNHLEGAQVASVWMEGGGGGFWNITGNRINPYWHAVDASPTHAYGIYINGSGGVNENNITGNAMLVNPAQFNPASLPIIAGISVNGNSGNNNIAHNTFYSSSLATAIDLNTAGNVVDANQLTGAICIDNHSLYNFIGLNSDTSCTTPLANSSGAMHSLVTTSNIYNGNYGLYDVAGAGEGFWFDASRHNGLVYSNTDELTLRTGNADVFMLTATGAVIDGTLTADSISVTNGQTFTCSAGQHYEATAGVGGAITGGGCVTNHTAPSGYTGTINVRNSAGDGSCGISVSNGQVTGTTCP